MRFPLINKCLLFLVSLLLGVASVSSQDIQNEKHIEVSLRMIGHQVMLNSGDSTSRILPIIEENGRYRIEFDTEFEINPDELVSTVDRVVKETDLADSYIVEVEDCETKAVVYSYEKNLVEASDVIPCRARLQPKSCYSLVFTLMKPIEAEQLAVNTADSASGPLSFSGPFKYVVGILFLLLAAGFWLVKKRKVKPAVNPNLIAMGEYHFDKRNTQLIIKDQRIELTSKEADLLLLLYNGANTTVERDVILNRIWGDEGDYVGRTLDVFISKLRKKLEFDAKVKIVNIRGVGYKLVMDV